MVTQRARSVIDLITRFLASMRPRGQILWSAGYSVGFSLAMLLRPYTALLVTVLMVVVYVVTYTYSVRKHRRGMVDDEVDP